MSDHFQSTSKLSYTIGGALVFALGTMTVASAQSPFASKKKTQAWENRQASQPAQPQTQPRPSYPQTAQPTGQAYPPQSYPPQSYQPTSSAPPAPVVTTQPTASPYQYKAPASSPPSYGTLPTQNNGQNTYQAPEQLPTYTGQPYQTQPYQDQTAPTYGQVQPYNAQGQSSPYPPTPYPPQTGGPQSYPPQSYPPQGEYGQPRSWKDKLGLGNLTTVFRGFFKGGVAMVNRDVGNGADWGEDFIADAKAEFEVSAITDSGYEYGANFELRGDYDKFRRGFGGRITDCPPTQAGCPSVLVGGVERALRGHTSRFYTDGPDEAEEAQLALESAHLFLRSSYGDVTVGRDDGAAYLFSLGAPTLLALGASNSTVDYTGLDSVKTVNDASGFSEKITYTSPRLLGDTIGLGVQFGASYALNARACGANYCVKRNDGTGALSPDLEDIFEVGLALDRTFQNGLKLEATATYATGSEQSAIAAFDDLQAYNFGAEMSWMDITLGGSFLKSNNGLLNGDYEAWDIGATWKPSDLGFTLGYGHAKDDLVNLTSDQFIAGVTYDFNQFTLGAGAQYIERETLGFDGTLVAPQTEKATAVFVEGGITF